MLRYRTISGSIFLRRKNVLFPNKLMTFIQLNKNWQTLSDLESKWNQFKCVIFRSIFSQELFPYNFYYFKN